MRDMNEVLLTKLFGADSLEKLEEQINQFKEDHQVRFEDFHPVAVPATGGGSVMRYFAKLQYVKGVGNKPLHIGNIQTGEKVGQPDSPQGNKVSPQITPQGKKDDHIAPTPATKTCKKCGTINERKNLVCKKCAKVLA